MDCSPISKKEEKNEMKRKKSFIYEKENEDTLVRQKKLNVIYLQGKDV